MPMKRYNVKDNTGNKVFSVVEDSECCERQCFGSGSSFIMNVTDLSNQEVIRLVHPFVCCTQELEVQSPPGTAIGYVRQNLNVCLPKFTVENEREVTTMIPSPDPYHFPSHLETFTRMDQLFVFREVTMEERIAEGFFGIKPIKKYNVKDETGNKVFSILEDSERYARKMYGSGRSFIMKITDQSNQEVIRLVHPSVCCYINHELEVQSPPGTPIGYVRQNLHACLPKFTVENEREITAMIPSSDPYYCPSHLDTLARINQLFVYQKQTTKEYVAEVCCGIIPVRSYCVTDGTGNKVFSILEDSECCDRL
ncbi:phospholipid scramblase 2-like protein [Labeo rohita]|uniref:Phospholipid scramblase n=1 Tax=Labeo rohita TaxID=84645 RepID=A0A498NUR3_LABRO|nr:phospholipid scramblase 2-like protein [Labeo rohita]